MVLETGYDFVVNILKSEEEQRKFYLFFPAVIADGDPWQAKVPRGLM